MMPGPLKVHAVLTFVLAVLFALFFQLVKHHPALSQVNAFAQDPYDAVGSFGVQLAAVTALLSLLRAFRPYHLKKAAESQQWLLVRAEALSCASVAVSLVTDAIALIRAPTLWMGKPAGELLATLVGGMALLTALVGWLLHCWAPTMRPSSACRVRTRAIGIGVASLLILAFYPESWRQSQLGELLTVEVGAILLFVQMWAIGTAVSPSPGTVFEDVLDDLASVYHWMKAQRGPFLIFGRLLEKGGDWSLVQRVLCWLNPRKHTWHLALLVGIAMGMMLMFAEAFGEGSDPHHIGRLVILASVFIGLEGLAVLLGYALLAMPLGLFRQDTKKKTSRLCSQKRI